MEDLLSNNLTQAAVSLAAIAFTFLLLPFFKRKPFIKNTLILINLLLGLRYFIWRAFYTLNLDTGASATVTFTVYFAELYGYVHVMLFYFQTYCPVKRQTPYHNGSPPAVDVFITTINEPPHMIMRTVVACRAMDWPADKINIYVLDDGKREEIKRLIEVLSCSYVTRGDIGGAKAGNINNALKITNSEFVMILDVDHIPVRSYLKETMPFFNDPSVAYVHTPHYFYNPDIFQRNLRLQKEIANDQDLFFKVIQEGRNYFNADFFGGSDAVFRRSVLNEVGGFKEETLTEDAHTSMHIHAKGYRSVFYNKNLTCGLTPETYHDYLRQRMRWAKGLTQLFLRDNPLLKKGLKISQRIIYFCSIYYFLHGFARLIYLAAPLSYLYLNIAPVKAGLPVLLNYYFSYYITSILVFKAISGKYRQPFWSDVYETVMHFHLCGAVIDGFIRPKKSLFKVTPKGLTVKGKSLDFSNSYFQLLLLLCMTSGIFYGVTKYLIGGRLDEGAWISVFWAAYNMLLLFAAVVTAREKPQLRRFHRACREMPCEITTDKGESFITYTRDISEGGMSFNIDKRLMFSPLITIRLIYEWGGLMSLKGKIARYEKAGNHYNIGVEFLKDAKDADLSIIRQIFSPPNVWEKEEGLRKEEGVLKSLFTIIFALFRSFKGEDIKRRTEPRVLARLKCLMGFEDRSKKGRVINLSYSGALISVRGGLQDGLAAVSLRIFSDKHNSELNIRGDILWRRSKGISTLLGIRLTKTDDSINSQLAEIISAG
ncbi:MAG: glycosyltransferase [Nitrospirae bacterium]|nr:glycosyltransferase [Nitrospirota bacterium]